MDEVWDILEDRSSLFSRIRVPMISGIFNIYSISRAHSFQDINAFVIYLSSDSHFSSGYSVDSPYDSHSYSSPHHPDLTVVSDHSPNHIYAQNRNLVLSVLTRDQNRTAYLFDTRHDTYLSICRDGRHPFFDLGLDLVLCQSRSHRSEFHIDFLLFVVYSLHSGPSDYPSYSPSLPRRLPLPSPNRSSLMSSLTLPTHPSVKVSVPCHRPSKMPLL